MIRIERWLALSATFALAACATAPAQKIVIKADHPAAADTGSADVQRVIEGVNMVHAGKIQAAIDGPLNEVVSRYEGQYGHSKEKIYNARGTTDALLYAALSASAKPPVSSTVIGPAWAMAYWGRGYAYNEMARYDDAIVELQKALALAPSDTQYNIEIGFSYQRKAQWQISLDHYQAAEDYAEITVPATEVDDLKCKALRGQGYDLVEMYQFDASRAAYRACLKLIPGEPRSLGELKYVDQAEAKKRKAG